MFSDVRIYRALVAPAARRRWLALMPMALIAGALEALGAAAVFGMVAILGDPRRAATLPIASSILPLLPARDDTAIRLSFTILVITFYVARNAWLIATAWAQERALDASITALAHRLFAGYLRAPYEFHLARNSAAMIQRADTIHVAFRLALGSIANIATEVLAIIALTVVLALTAPLVTLTAMVMTAALIWLPLVISRRLIARWSAEAHRLEVSLLQMLQQGLGGVKEIILGQRQPFFIQAFDAAQRPLTGLRGREMILSNAQRLIIEALFVTAVLTASLIVTWRHAGADVVPLLGLYAYAGFRLLPSATRIVLHVGHIRIGRASIQALYTDLDALDLSSPVPGATTSSPAADMSFSDRIVVEDVEFAYQGSASPALRGVNLVIRKGEFIGIVGPSGAGKSTLVDVLLGLLPPTCGRVTVDGHDIHDAGALPAWQRRIGYVPQQPFLLDDTLRRNVAFGVPETEIDDRRVASALRLAQLTDFVAKLPLGIATTLGERGARLSGGQRQRVAIARALYHEPELIVLDEATSTLDPQTERDLRLALEHLRRVKTVVIIAHRMTTVSRCDRVILLRDGLIAATGAPDELPLHN
jgi:ABC-type multidrug transport system fused ATPase/permease subunit